MKRTEAEKNMEKEFNQKYDKIMKKAEKNKACKNCEFNMGECGYHYRPISELEKEYPNGCEEWELAFVLFQEALLKDNQ